MCIYIYVHIDVYILYTNGYYNKVVHGAGHPRRRLFEQLGM